jgi:hypothetical protein
MATLILRYVNDPKLAVKLCNLCLNLSVYCALLFLKIVV